MAFEEEVKDLFDQFIESSKGFAIKTGEKAKEMGERGMLMIDIKKAESKIQKLHCRLGEEVLRAFVDHDVDTIKRDDPVLEKILAEIALLSDSLDRMKAEQIEMKK